MISSFIENASLLSTIIILGIMLTLLYVVPKIPKLYTKYSRLNRKKVNASQSRMLAAAHLNIENALYASLKSDMEYYKTEQQFINIFATYQPIIKDINHLVSEVCVNVPYLGNSEYSYEISINFLPKRDVIEFTIKHSKIEHNTCVTFQLDEAHEAKCYLALTITTFEQFNQNMQKLIQAAPPKASKPFIETT